MSQDDKQLVQVPGEQPAPRISTSARIAAFFREYGCGMGCVTVAVLVIAFFGWRVYHRKTSQPTATEKIEQAVNDEKYATNDDTVERRLQVRQLVTEYVKSELPDWSVSGISISDYYRGNIYVIGVDISSAQKRKTLDLIARLYVAEDGKSYWKVERLTPERRQIFAGTGTQKQEEEPPEDDK